MRHCPTMIRHVLALIFFLFGKQALGCDQVCTLGSCANQVFDTCSVTCDNSGHDTVPATCEGARFSNSTVTCIEEACIDADFVSSDVTCTATDCKDSLFDKSVVHCMSGVFTCRKSKLRASEVKCDTSSCAGVVDCSCCDGRGCPDGSLSCTDNPLGFCSSKSVGRTCKEWENPACEGVSVGKYHFLSWVFTASFFSSQRFMLIFV